MDDLHRLEELFERARALDEAGRAELLRSLDEAERTELASLLDQLDQEPDFLEPGATSVPGLPAGFERLGAYRLLRLVGEGGMGAVFLARQDRPDRLVAIKIVHPALLSGTAAGRLEREGEALGRLQHPGIARVIEVGSAPGPFDAPLSFVAMEWIDGRPIDEHCEASALSQRARLALVAEVADALQHAHERGVVHRDLKPSNVLVDSEGRPHVLDFGIARLVDESGAQALTASGQVLGTPAYMAPEQVGGGPAAGDPRVDVWALGALTYQLLAGRPPLELGGKTPVQALAEVARAEPVPLRRRVPAIDAELARLVHAALDRDPDRRHPSCAHLAADLRAYLDHRPISVRPPSLGYRLRKLVQRRRTAVLVATGGLAVALVAGAALWRSRHATVEQADQTRALLTLLRTRLEEKDPFRGEPLQAGDVRELEQAERWIEEELGSHPLLAAELRETLAGIQRARGEAEHALALARAARLLDEQELGPDDPRTLSALGEEGLCLLELRRFPEAETLLRRTRQAWCARGDGEATEALSVQHNLALSIKMQGRLTEAEPLYRECLEVRTRRFGAGHASVLSTASTLARLLQDSGRVSEAVDLLSGVYEQEASTLGEDAPETCITASMLGGALTALGEVDDARTLLEAAVDGLTRALGADHPETLASRRNLAAMFTRAADHESARRVLVEVIPDARARFGADEERTLDLLSRLGTECVALERYEEAIPIWAEVFEGLRGRLATDPARALTPLQNELQCLLAVGRLDEARAPAAELLEAARERLPEGAPLRTAAEEIGRRLELE